MSTAATANRRRFLQFFASLGLSSTLLPGVLWAHANENRPHTITKEVLRSAVEVAGLTFTDPELDAMIEGINRNFPELASLRDLQLENSVSPPLYFNPLLPGMRVDRAARPFRAGNPPESGDRERQRRWPFSRSQIWRT